MKRNFTKKRNFLIAGLTIIVVLIASFFIKLTADSGANFVEKDSLLGIIIFHNPFILAGYILVAIILILKGTRR